SATARAPRRDLYYARLQSGERARLVTPPKTFGDSIVVDDSDARFTTAGNAFLFGVLPAHLDTATTSQRAPGTPVVWDASAAYTPLQLRVRRKPQSPTAIYWPDTDRWVRL